MNAYRIFLGLAGIGIAVADAATILMVATEQSKYFGFAFGGMAAATIGIAGLVMTGRFKTASDYIGISARHTEIVQLMATPFGTLVREDYYRYPKTESNLYLVDSKGALIWFAEKAMDGDAFANPIHRAGPASVKCTSWEGFDCEIDLRTGKLIGTEFLK